MYEIKENICHVEGDILEGKKRGQANYAPGIFGG